MAEVTTSIFFKSKDSKQQKKLVSLFKTGLSYPDDFEDIFCKAAIQISGDDASDVAQNYLEDIDNNANEAFSLEDLSTEAGFCRADFLCGHGAEKLALSTLKFLDEIAPGMTLRAWGTGDDDPWEFWVKRENGASVKLDDSPGCGHDTQIVGTIYRWWHEGLPPKLKEGLIGDEDLEAEEEGGSPVSDKDYEKWLARLTPKNDMERAVSDIVNDELNNALLDGLTKAFFGDRFGSAKKTVNSGAFDAETLNEETIRLVLDDMQAQIKAKNVDGLMRHYSKKSKARIITNESGKPKTTKMGYMLYRMSYKLTFLPEMDYSSEMEVENISISGDVATVTANETSSYVDPDKKRKIRAISEDVYEMQIIDGKLQIISVVANQTELH